MVSGGARGAYGMSRSDFWFTFWVILVILAAGYFVSFTVKTDPITPVATVERTETTGGEVYARLQILEKKQALTENSILLMMRNQEKVIGLIDQIFTKMGIK